MWQGPNRLTTRTHHMRAHMSASARSDRRKLGWATIVLDGSCGSCARREAGSPPFLSMWYLQADFPRDSRMFHAEITLSSDMSDDPKGTHPDNRSGRVTQTRRIIHGNTTVGGLFPLCVSGYLCSHCYCQRCASFRFFPCSDRLLCAVQVL